MKVAVPTECLAIGIKQWPKTVSGRHAYLKWALDQEQLHLTKIQPKALSASGSDLNLLRCLSSAGISTAQSSISNAFVVATKRNFLGTCL